MRRCLPLLLTLLLVACDDDDDGGLDAGPDTAEPPADATGSTACKPSERIETEPDLSGFTWVEQGQVCQAGPQGSVGSEACAEPSEDPPADVSGRWAQEQIAVARANFPGGAGGTVQEVTTIYLFTQEQDGTRIAARQKACDQRIRGYPLDDPDGEPLANTVVPARFVEDFR